MQNTSYIANARGSKNLFITNFYSLSMKTSTLVEINHLEISQVFDNMIQLSEFPVSGSSCEDLIHLTLND